MRHPSACRPTANLAPKLATLLAACCLVGVFPASAAQFARPLLTVSTGSWTAVSAATLHEAADETTANGDVDYASATVDTTLELQLAGVTDPLTGAGHVLRLSAKCAGSGGPERIDYAIYQGATLIASWANVTLVRGSYTLITNNLTTTEANAITDYNDLRVRVASVSLGSGESVWLTWTELEVPDAPVINPPTLTGPTVPFGTITATSAVLGATITTNGGAAMSSRGTVWNLTGPAITENSLAEGGTATGTYTHTRSVLPPGSLVYFRAYAVNSGGTGFSSDVSFYTEPDVQPSSLTFTNVTSTGLRINWLAGGGTGTIVVMKQGGAVDSDPVDGTSHTANAAFGAGAELGTSNYIVYRGSGNLVDISGLTPTTTYFVALYTFAGATTQINYQQMAPTTGQQTTLPPGPAAPTLTTPTVSNVTASAAMLGAWITTNGGDGITERGTLWNTTGAPITENLLAEGGAATGVFSHLRASLPAATLIHYRGFAANTVGTGYSPDGSFYTEPSLQASTVTFTNLTNTSVRLQWTPGSGSGSIVVMKQDSAVDADPVDGTAHPADSVFGSGANLGGGNSVVCLAATNAVTVTSLLPTTTYHVAVYAYAGSGTLINYALSLPARSNVTTLASPAAPSHNSQYVPYCATCHAHGLHTTYAPRGDEQEARCKTCHNPTGMASNKSAIAMHTYDGTNTLDCGTCHEVHGNVAWRTSYDPATGISNVNLSFLRGNMIAYSPTNAFGEALWSNMLFQVRPDQFAFTNAPYNGACQVCHTTTTYHRNNDSSNHTHNAGSACTSCHGHGSGFAPTGGGSCVDCHDEVQNNGDGMPAAGRRAIVGEFGLRSHHVTGTVANADCEVCHEMTEHQQGQVRLFNVDSPTTVYTISNGVNPTVNVAAAIHLTAFCIACHDADGADGLAPFSDGVMPPVVSNAIWAASAHSTGAGSCYGNGSTFGCHSSGHGSEKANLLAPYNVAADPTTCYEEEEGFCFGCHSSAGLSTNDVASRFAPAIRWVTDAVDGTRTNLNDRHDVQHDAQTRSGARLECTDCHDPHGDTFALPVKPDPDPSDGRLPGTGQVMTNTDFYTEWCLDCHDGSFPSSITAPTQTLVNIRTEHITDAHGAADGAASLKSGYGYVDNMTVRCLYCHTSQHVSTNRNLFQLKDIVTATNGVTAVTSDGGAGYTLISNNVANTAVQGYDWCNTCHVSSMGSTRANCFDCHFHSTRF